jgi:hypothetical protein
MNLKRYKMNRPILKIESGDLIGSIRMKAPLKLDCVMLHAQKSKNMIPNESTGTADTQRH